MRDRRPLALLLACLSLTACSSPSLPTPPAPALNLPEAHPPAEMRIAAINAGRMYSKAALAYRGGRMDDERVFGVGAILVQHPEGALLFDSGFGPGLDEHFKTTPPLMRLTTKYGHEPTVAEQLEQAGIAPRDLTAVVLTHAHWDHISGLEALPGVPVWVTAEEKAFVDGGDRFTLLARKLGTSTYRIYDFPNGPYLGFARSRDVFGDGSVVLVPAPGHTPGSIIAFLSLPDGKRYALIGDLAWQREGIDLPAEKPWIAKSVDADRDATRAMLIRMHQVQAAVPGLVIVPAHDRRIWNTLPKLRTPVISTETREMSPEKPQ